MHKYSDLFDNEIDELFASHVWLIFGLACEHLDMLGAL